ncbi:MAG TPA: CYTH domain-containing protein [Devosia sp.]|nr:CYTH domain-containing protein [Devosia sp.]
MSAKPKREIERKFLVKGDGWRRKAVSETQIEQGYLARGRRSIIRIRIKDGKSATLTVKSREGGVSRAEFEYRIPIKDAKVLMELCGPLRIDKHRYEVPVGRRTWEVDVFGGGNKGLVLAEIEMESEEEEVDLPRWAGKEVTDDPRYRNSNLVKKG